MRNFFAKKIFPYFFKITELFQMYSRQRGQKTKKPTSSAETEYIMRELISTAAFAVIISVFALFVMSI